MGRHLGMLIVGFALAAMLVLGCSVSPIPVPLPGNEGGVAQDSSMMSDSGSALESGVMPDMGAPDTFTAPDLAPGDAGADAAGDGPTEAGSDVGPDVGPDAEPGDGITGAEGFGPEASAADLCGEC